MTARYAAHFVKYLFFRLQLRQITHEQPALLAVVLDGRNSIRTVRHRAFITWYYQL
jgi:hypothetical protein